MTAQTTTSIATFITRMLDADEAAARAATPGPWFDQHDGAIATAPPEVDDDGFNIGTDGDHIVHVSFESNGPANIKHIARHDPARVLAQVAAMRAIVELHAPTKQLGDLAPVCESCLTDRAGYSDDWGPDRWPCSTLTALATIWADDPGWQESWR